MDNEIWDLKNLKSLHNNKYMSFSSHHQTQELICCVFLTYLIIYYSLSKIFVLLRLNSKNRNKFNGIKKIN